MSTSVDILFLDSQTLGQPESLEAILQVFIKSDFEIYQVNSGEKLLSQEKLSKDNLGILQKAYDCQTLSFSALNPTWRLEIFQQIAWGEFQMGAKDRAYIRTSTDNVGFWRDGYDNAYYCSLFLELGKALYDVVKPLFGWIDLYYGWTTTHEDIEKMDLTYLYWANFFGSKYVERLGRDKILNAPAWKIETLHDGGLLYLLAPHLGNTDDHVSVTAVKEYFGVEHVR